MSVWSEKKCIVFVLINYAHVKLKYSSSLFAQLPVFQIGEELGRKGFLPVSSMQRQIARYVTIYC